MPSFSCHGIVILLNTAQCSLSILLPNWETRGAPWCARLTVGLRCSCCYSFHAPSPGKQLAGDTLSSWSGLRWLLPYYSVQVNYLLPTTEDNDGGPRVTHLRDADPFNLGCRSSCPGAESCLHSPHSCPLNLTLVLQWSAKYLKLTVSQPPARGPAPPLLPHDLHWGTGWDQTPSCVQKERACPRATNPGLQVKVMASPTCRVTAPVTWPCWGGCTTGHRTSVRVRGQYR